MQIHLSWSSNHTVPYTLNTQDDNVQITRVFADVCHLHQLRRPQQHHQDILTDEADRPQRKLL